MTLSRLLIGTVAVLTILAAHFQTTAATSSQTAVDYRVRADLSCQCIASGKARYRERDRRGLVEQRFDVSVEDAVPGSMWHVHVNEIMVGIIVIDDFGMGELQYRTPDFIDEPGDGDPIPDGFPTLIEGDTITVGPLAGTFEAD